MAGEIVGDGLHIDSGGGIAPDVCGTCHPEALTDHDRSAVREFERFLRMVADAPSYICNGREVTIIDWRWEPYVDRAELAPPLLWEGENA